MPAVRYLRDVLIFALCYVALDWASYIDPVGPFNITPWNPQHGLAITWLLLGGLHHAPAVLATVLVAEFVIRDFPGGVLITLLTSLSIAGGFSLIAWLLRESIADLGLRSTRDLTVFVAIVIAGTALTGTTFVGLLRGADMLGATPVSEALVRFWVGDAVGILITAPLLLAVADAERRAALIRLARRPETWLQVAALIVAIELTFYGLEGDPARHFYFLFVPLIWIAARGGMNGAVVASGIVQIGVVVGIHHADAGAVVPVLELHALVVALTLTGLYLGMMVDERERVSNNLRQTLRLAAAGEMAGAIAHEVNQPLTALTNYGESALMVMKDPRAQEHVLLDIIEKMLQESRRAAEVVRRLRDFFRSGTTRLEPLSPDDLLVTVRRIGQQVLGAESGILTVHEEPELPPLYVDRMQLEVVIRNLLANAREALDGGDEKRKISVDVRRHDDKHVCMVFADSGPGLTTDTRHRIFEPFVSGKATGMGLGLAISRAIAEAHGGSLQAHAARHGEFHLILPCDPTA